MAAREEALSMCCNDFWRESSAGFGDSSEIQLNPAAPWSLPPMSPLSGESDPQNPEFAPAGKSATETPAPIWLSASSTLPSSAKTWQPNTPIDVALIQFACADSARFQTSSNPSWKHTGESTLDQFLTSLSPRGDRGFSQTLAISAATLFALCALSLATFRGWPSHLAIATPSPLPERLLAD